MITKTYSATTYGVDAQLISIEVNIISGTELFIVGLPDGAVKESRYRIESVLKSLDKRMPRQRVIVNLAPASIKKEGASYDLPIALAILQASQQEIFPQLQECLIAGELALDGVLRPIRGALPMAIEAQKRGLKKLLLPKENSKEAAIVPDLSVIPIQHITEAIDHLTERSTIHPLTVNTEKLFAGPLQGSTLDLEDIQGQAIPKRALEIAASGGHNLLMIGPPGVGKSMLAKRLPSILPPLTLAEAIETTKIYSVVGKTHSKTLITERPFRTPHHTISEVALVGGGSIPQPGEISLAHHGVLALEELTEFRRSVLEVLRQPLEDQQITVSRTKLSVTFPANFMLVASMNPCPCGYYTHPEKKCSCTPLLRKKYLNKISAPLLDRIDLHLHLYPVKMNSSTDVASHEESSAVVRKRVIQARERQLERFRSYEEVHCNAMIAPRMIKTLIHLTPQAASVLNQAIERLNFSTRAYHRILKVARTIADLADQKDIETAHIAEAIQYRSLDRDSWGG